jgi:hypothetical protein
MRWQGRLLRCSELDTDVFDLAGWNGAFDPPDSNACARVDEACATEAGARIVNEALKQRPFARPPDEAANPIRTWKEFLSLFQVATAQTPVARMRVPRFGPFLQAKFRAGAGFAIEYE